MQTAMMLDTIMIICARLSLSIEGVGVYPNRRPPSGAQSVHPACPAGSYGTRSCSSAHPPCPCPPISRSRPSIAVLQPTRHLDLRDHALVGYDHPPQRSSLLMLVPVCGRTGNTRSLASDRRGAVVVLRGLLSRRYGAWVCVLAGAAHAGECILAPPRGNARSFVFRAAS